MHALLRARAMRLVSQSVQHRALSSLSPLIDIINRNATNLESIEQKNSTPIPSLSEPFHPKSEAFRRHPEAAESAAQIVAAALQLAATLSPPLEAIYQIAAGPFKGAALRICMEANVAEILREVGPKGIHVQEISQKNGQDPKKLARFLRYLATNHIFEEIEPDVFRNNRLSALLDTGKDSAALSANPGSKYEGTTGITAIANHHLDEVAKASVHAWENLSDPVRAMSEEQRESPLANYLGKEVSIWEWFEEPEQAARRKRFDIAMKGATAMQSAQMFQAGYDWGSLPKGSTVVDVGGGIGFATAAVYEKFPELNYIVQDLPAAIPNAEQFWAERHPEAIGSKAVTLESHSCFEPQPQRDVSVFFLKHVLHGCSDKYGKKVLDHLRAAASKDTKLVVSEYIVPLACRSSEVEEGVPGSKGTEAPAPLLANYGLSGVYSADMAMFFASNAQERTFRDMQRLLISAGWKVVKVNRQDGGGGHLVPQFYEAIPV